MPSATLDNASMTDFLAGPRTDLPRSLDAAALDILTEAVWEELQTLGYSSCILGARAAVEVLNRRGVHAYALSVSLMGFNPNVTHRLSTHGYRTTPEELVKWVHEPGCWSFGVGVPGQVAEGANGWPGHLVAVARVAPDRVVVIDPTLPQFDRPAHSIRLHPASMEANASFEMGEEPLCAEIGGSRLIYWARLDDLSFMATPAWMQASLPADTLWRQFVSAVSQRAARMPQVAEGSNATSRN